MFVGVNAGYRGDAPVQDPQEAQRIVGQKLAFIQRSGTGDKNTYKIYPALVVYRREWSCPEGGEAAAAVTTAGEVTSAIHTAEVLRDALDQSTVTVVSSTGSHGDKTIGFTARADHADLRKLGKAWQEAAEQYFLRTDIYVTCGLYAQADGKIVLQSESNPLYKLDPEAWKQAATEIAATIERSLNIPLNLSFREAGFTYLHAPGRPNSRGIIA